MKKQVYLNAAALMPLSTFSEEGLLKYVAFQQMGPGAGRLEYVNRMQAEIRSLFAELIGAQASEIGLIHCTKAGELIVLDAVDTIKPGGNIVTNDLHFSGSLHNLVGLKKAGREVRVIRARDWQVSVADMAAAIDDNTAVVTISLVSNINGHIEDIAAISRVAHEHGAVVYADIIQAAGILDIDVRQLGIDVAACACYKWLYGVHGTGFLYVRSELQGTALPDRLWPGNVRRNYAPWGHEHDTDLEEFSHLPPQDATRYQPGHVSYLGYCAAYEGLKFVHRHGPRAALEHSIKLNQRLKTGLDPDRYPCISPHPERAPVITFESSAQNEVNARLQRANVVVSHAEGRLRVSPALFNNESDIDVLLEALA